MNHKIKFLKRITLFLCILMLSANCASDDNSEKPGGNSTAKLKETQKWFNKYESDGENYFLLDNLQYNWDEAKITNSEDGTETTIVPIIESKKDNREFWEQRLYIYKTGKEDYEALVYEIATNKYVLLSSQSIDGGEFTGFISVWDLKAGFVRAARFENNQVIQTTIGNTTTVGVNGIVSIVMPIDGLGTIYSYPMSYSIKVNNTNGKIISGSRVK